MNNQINYSPNMENWKITAKDRSKNRMKIQVKLTSQEAEACRNFIEATKPPDVSDSTFFKALFMKGWETYHKDVESKYVSHIEENREQYEASGFTFDEEGKLTGFGDGAEVEGEGSVEVVEE